MTAAPRRYIAVADRQHHIGQRRAAAIALWGAAAGSLGGSRTMDLEKYTERSKGFVQSAQNLALRSGHQRLTPEHLAQGAAGGQGRALRQSDPRRRRRSRRWCCAQVEAELDKQPRVEGSGAGQVYLVAGVGARVRPGREDRREGRRQLRHRRAAAAGAGDGAATRRRARRWPPGMSRRRASTPRSSSCARAARPTAPRPRKAMTR